MYINYRCAESRTVEQDLRLRAFPAGERQSTRAVKTEGEDSKGHLHHRRRLPHLLGSYQHP